MKIYTKTGDKGETSLFGGKRVSKAHPRIEAYGTIDELNVYIGMTREQFKDERIRRFLLKIQNTLFTIGAYLATYPKKNHLKKIELSNQDVLLLENEIDYMNEHLIELKAFILPGGHPSICFCHLARVVCRRAERLLIVLDEQEKVDSIIIQYLNRLSDYCFVLGREMAHQLGIEEILWKT